jgi:hypothetical protein
MHVAIRLDRDVARHRMSKDITGYLYGHIVRRHQGEVALAIDIDVAGQGVDIDGSAGRCQCDITGVLNERIVRNRDRIIVGRKDIKVARQGTQSHIPV